MRPPLHLSGRTAPRCLSTVALPTPFPPNPCLYVHPFTPHPHHVQPPGKTGVWSAEARGQATERLGTLQRHVREAMKSGRFYRLGMVDSVLSDFLIPMLEAGPQGHELIAGNGVG